MTNKYKKHMYFIYRLCNIAARLIFEDDMYAKIDYSRAYGSDVHLYVSLFKSVYNF